MNTLAKDAHYLQAVRQQYENYPYPPRDPEQEKTLFKYIYLAALDLLNYYHFSGRRDFTKGFRALVAGGGTGDSTLMLAEQLRDMDADIIHLDISEASIAVAKQRAAVRGLDNITWVHGSLLDASEMLEGKFDYINCIGVLHHLESPEAGLAALTSVLKDDGVMAIMLYAKYGRAGVYQIQELMRILNQGENDMRRKIEHCKAVLKNLPATSTLRDVQHLLKDAETYGDIGIYDLFLHSQDVAYSVPELYALLAISHLELTHFFFEGHKEGNDLYQPEAYIRDGSLSDIFRPLPLPEKQAAAELLHGKMFKHAFLAAKKKPSLPDVTDLDNVPFFSMLMNRGVYNDIHRALGNYKIGEAMTCGLYGREVQFTKTAHAERIFQYMDGYKSLGDIFKAIRECYPATERKPGMEELKQEFSDIFSAFIKQDWMFLRHTSVPATRGIQDIHEVMARRYSGPVGA